tara:strand:+ start:1166 stop:3469 length:2304 start_codon:yes stop_codon:yes gene_type:complete
MQQNKSFEKEEISIKEIFFIIKSNINKILLSLIISLIIAFLYFFSVRPTYKTSGTIIIDDQNSSVSSIFDMGLSSDKNYLDNEIQVLKSRTTAEMTIKALLNSDFKDNLHLFETRKFEDSVLRSTLRKFLFLDWYNKTIEDIDNVFNDSLFNQYTNNLRANLSISNLDYTDVLRVTYESNSPEEAALIVNTLIDVYQKRDQQWAAGEMSHLKYFLIEQLTLKKDELDKIEQELREFQEKEHIYGLDDNSNLLLSQLTTVESDFYNTEAKKNILFERKKYFENQLNQDEKKFTERVSNTLDVQLYSIRQELSSLEAEYISTKSREGDSHPAVIKLNKKINNLKKVLSNETQKYMKQGIAVANPIQHRQAIMDSVINLDVYISGYNSKLSELKNLVLKYENQLSTLPKKYLEFSRFQRDKVILDETYSLMKQKLEEVKINEASQLGKIRIVDSAKPNFKKSSPNTKLIFILSIFFGLTIGIMIVFLYEFFDSTIKSIDEIERRGLPILAIIPSIETENTRSKRIKKKGYKFSADKIERRLLTHEDPKSPISEAYRSLRTSLMYDAKQNNGRIILVSSPGPGEGKTTTIANLAITYANMGRKTLLVELDFRKPVMNKMFKNNKGNRGLTNFLSGAQEDIDDLIYDSNVDNLKIISSGVVPPNPSELLGSKKMDDFIDKVKTNFDIILLDTPPLIAVTDAFIVAKYVSKFILVVRASVTQKGALERSLDNMSNVNHNVDGVVFNGVDSSNTYGGGYYYQYYQNYYGTEDNK